MRILILKKGIRAAKASYSRKIETYFEASGDAKSMWKGLKCIAEYKGPLACKPVGPSAEDFSKFYARVEEGILHPPGKICGLSADKPLILSESEVMLWLGRTNVRKAAGPDIVPGSVLRNCWYFHKKI